MNCLSSVVPGPGVPVVALPYAGAVSSPVAVLRAALPPGAALLTARYPGHGGSAGEPLSDPEQLLELLEADLTELSRVAPAPILIGFSMGGGLAFELARRATARARPPRNLVLCVTRAPHTGVGHTPIARMPAAEFAAAAVRLGLAAPEVVGLPGAGTLLRTLQTDLAIVERMPTVFGPMLTVPATVIGASSDWLVPEPALRRWGDLLTDPLHLRVPGTHLGWLGAPAPMSVALARGIARAAGPGGAA